MAAPEPTPLASASSPGPVLVRTGISGVLSGMAGAVAAAQLGWVETWSQACLRALEPSGDKALAGPGLTVALAAGVGLLAAWTGWALDSWARRMGLLASAVLVAATQSMVLARLYDLVWEPVSMALAMTAGMVTSGLLAPKGSGMQQWFQGRLGRPVLQKLSNARSVMLLAPDQREAAVVTCRILNETALREQMPAREFLKLMEAFRQTASRLLMERGALLDAPESGAVRGFFGLPVAVENHASEAALAGLALAEAMQQFAVTHLHRDYLPVECGTGITCGTLTAGLSGETYTVAGDAVEQSRWLAGLNAEYQTRILTDVATHRMAEGTEDRPLEILNPPEGAALEVYQLLAPAGGLSRESLARRDAFRDAIMLLRAGHAGDALRRFEDARDGLVHEDAPLERFISLAEEQAARDGAKLPLPERSRPRHVSRKIPRL